MEEEDDAPNSPRRRRITSSGPSKVIKPHINAEDKLNPPPLSIGTTQIKTQTTAPLQSIKTEELKDNDNEIVTWSNLIEQTKTAKIEKFLWDANISDEIGKTDNNLLKVCCLFCCSVVCSVGVCLVFVYSFLSCECC